MSKYLECKKFVDATFFLYLLLFLFLPIKVNSESELLNKEFYQSDAYEATDELPPEIIKNLPSDINAQVAYFLKYFTKEKKETVERWLARCSLFLPYFKTIFKEYGLPEDLVYLAYIESGCNPLATSPAGAAGIWQFMKLTAKKYGLKINYWIDERRDFIKSTHAAAQYLKNLYEQFGDWRIAIASYNSGENRLRKILKAKNFANYWQVINSDRLPAETSAYLPKWMAITLIAKNPEEYGFSVPTNVIDYEEIAVNGGVDLKVFSVAGNIDYKMILLLNAELRKKVTPPGTFYKLKIPFEKKKILQEGLVSLKTVVKRKRFYRKIVNVVTLPD
ncbi:MAG: lytic transglycosylase domain-containing protein [Thermodesulfobacterium sp.]|nr:lytic transglycosylase domain-containing protein [Thermodesulfobacterium sp.]